MEFSDLRARLNSEYARFRAVATDLQAPVPSCPGWLVHDLVQHVAGVYQRRVISLQTGQAPPPRPVPVSREAAAAGESSPAPTSTEPAADAGPELDVLDRAFHALTAEFDAREPGAATWSWWAPDQTVGFWIRRMAHETAIHRYDAELAAEQTNPVVNDLALDGVDEALTVVLPDAGEVSRLADVDLPTIEVRLPARAYFVRPTLAGVFVDETGEAATTIEGVPSDLLLWLWRRADADPLHVIGDPAGVAVLSRLMETATQ